MTRDIGLSERELKLIRAVLGRHPEVSSALLYGSRAKGAARPSSDIDLALLGTSDSLIAARIAGEMEELPLPYRFDVQAYTAIRHPPLREHIDRVGITIFARQVPVGVHRRSSAATSSCSSISESWTCSASTPTSTRPTEAARRRPRFWREFHPELKRAEDDRQEEEPPQDIRRLAFLTSEPHAHNIGGEDQGGM
jgi:predicted nucleotidyltransferase